MKRKRAFLLIIIIGVSVGLGLAAYHADSDPDGPPASYFPSDALLYLQAKDFSSLLADWNGSPQKQEWLRSSNYEVFSRSRLLLRLRDAGKQFATAAGLPPDINFLTQVAGSQSALALYDIGKLQFLYITRLPSANSMQSQLWQTRSKFETRSAAGVTFYLRRDPESDREVGFAVNGDYLLLSTREDLITGALQLMAGPQNGGGETRSLQSEPWWSQSVAAAATPGDLRMVLNLDKIVPSPYFRSYWVQQNITDMKRYSAAVSDLFRSGKEYREERVLLRKAASGPSSPPSPNDVTDLLRLVPENAGFYQAKACPSIESCLDPLEAKILAPHLGPAPAQQIAPQAPVASFDTGASSDLETRIDQAPAHASDSQASTSLKVLLQKNQVRAVLQVESSERDNSDVFVRIHSAIVLAGGSDWDEAAARNALSNFVRPTLTVSQLGVGWKPMTGYYELDGLRRLLAAARGRYLIISDDPSLISAMLNNLNRRLDSKPAVFVAGFSHERERKNFARLTAIVDRPDVLAPETPSTGRQPQFFSENVASLSSALAGVSAEKIVVRDAGDKLVQTVTYEWSQ